MTRQLTERYLQARRIALAAMDMDAQARDVWVVAETAGDTDLENEVRWLIASAEDGHTTPAPHAPVSVDLSGHDAQATAPRHYRILRRLGEGGMGVVYLAERSDGDFVQQVALKFLSAAAEGSPILMERFTRERKLLARLEHPGIARLLDGGVLEDGRPFLTLEYVDGQRIDTWCDAQALNLRQRIVLFLKVCAAVSFAHRNLVIHRDLKPANILVTDDGLPKLLDFGIARIIDANSDTTLTETGAQVLTLAYASPEQIERQPLTTAADVYSLGVVLYQLVSGRRPFQHLTSPRHISNAIVEGDVVPPSRSAPLQGEGVEVGATARERVPADIDAIVLKAMRRQAGERYATVGELTADLERFLDKRPVLARRGRRLYHLRRYIQRNRWGFTAAAAVLLAVLSGVGATLYALADARAQQHLAVSRQHQLERMTHFQQAMFQSVDIRAMGHALATAERDQVRVALVPMDATGNGKQLELVDAKLQTAFAPDKQTEIARGVLDDYLVTHALDRVDAAFPDAPLVAADLRQSLTRVLVGIGSYAHAETELRKVLDARSKALPATDPSVLSAQIDLGDALYRQGNMQAALDTYNRAAENASGRPISDHLRVAAQSGLARVLFAQGHQQQALQLQKSLFEQIHAVLPPTDPGLLRLRRDLVLTLMGAGQRDQAVEQSKSLVALSRQALGEDDPRTLDAMLTLSKLLHYRYEYEQSLQLARQVAGTRQQRLGFDHPETLAAQNMVATDMVYLAQDSKAFAAAHGLLDRVVAARQRVLGPDHPDTVASMTVLVRLLAKQADFSSNDAEERSFRERAVALERDILVSHQRLLGLDHPATLMALGSLASLLDAAGDYPEALARAKETLAGQSRVLGNNHPVISATLTLIGDINRDAGNWTAARAAYIEALQARERLLGLRDAHTIETASRLHLAMIKLHDADAAKAVRERYLDPVIAMDPAKLNASMRSIREEAIAMLQTP